MADFTCRTEIPTIVEIGDVDHVRFVRAFNTTVVGEADRDLMMEYRLISDDSGDPGFTGPVGRVFDPGYVRELIFPLAHFPPHLCDRDSPFSWTREISRVFSARTQESEECRALIYTTVREVFAVELPATLLSAFATSCKTTPASSEARNTSPTHFRIFDPR